VATSKKAFEGNVQANPLLHAPWSSCNENKRPGRAEQKKDLKEGGGGWGVRRHKKKKTAFAEVKGGEFLKGSTRPSQEVASSLVAEGDFKGPRLEKKP